MRVSYLIAFALISTIVLPPEADARRLRRRVIPKTADNQHQRSDIVFFGTPIRRVGDLVTLDIKKLYKGPGKEIEGTNREVVMLSRYSFEEGKSYFVFASALEPHSEGIFATDPFTREQKIPPTYMSTSSRDSRVVLAIVGDELNKTFENVRRRCTNLGPIELGVSRTGYPGLLNASPTEKHDCVLDALEESKTVLTTHDSLPYSAAFRDGSTKIHVADFNPNPDDREKIPAELLSKIEVSPGTDLSEALNDQTADVYKLAMKVCKVSGMRDALIHTNRSPSNSFGKVLFRCGLYHRDFDFALTHFGPGPAPARGVRFSVEGSIHRTERFLIEKMKPALTSPIDSSDYVSLRLHLAKFGEPWGNVPVLVELFADAWRKNGDAKLAAAAYWRLSLLEPARSESWQTLAKKSFPGIETEPAVMELQKKFGSDLADFELAHPTPIVTKTSESAEENPSNDSKRSMYLVVFFALVAVSIFVFKARKS